VRAGPEWTPANRTGETPPVIEPVPSTAASEPLAYALTADAGAEVLQLLTLHRKGDPTTTQRLLSFFESATPRPSDQRMTPLDPRLPALLVRLGANEYVQARLMDDAGEGEVYAEVERDAMNDALSLMRLIEMEAPGIGAPRSSLNAAAAVR